MATSLHMHHDLKDRPWIINWLRRNCGLCFGSSRTALLSHSLNGLLVPNKFNGLVWFGFSINGSVLVLKLGFIGFWLTFFYLNSLLT